MSEISIVGVSGSLSKPSRTSALVSAVLEGISIKSGLPATLLELSDSAAELFAARSSASASPRFVRSNASAIRPDARRRSLATR